MADRATGPPIPRSKRPGARKALLLVAAVLAMSVSAASAVAVGAIKHYEQVFTRGGGKVAVGPSCTGSGCIKHVNPYCADHICDFLILGSDTRAGLSKKQQQQFGTTQRTKGQRADTIIFVRFDPPHHRTVVLSIPRDLRVRIAGHGLGKINTAFGYGPDAMVQAVEKLTGMRINHYVEVNFIGFEALVDTLGGVSICIDRPLIDSFSGLRLPHRGCYSLRGPQALAFVRARHVQGDIIPDFSRIARQQQFMRAITNKVLSAGALTRLPAFIDAAKNNLRIDDHLTLYDLQDLSHRLAGLDQKDLYFRVVPSVPVQANGDDFLQLDQPRAAKLFRRIRNGRPLGTIGLESQGTPISPADVTVHVLDDGSNGKAAAVQSYLKKAGFVVDLEASPGGLPSDTILWGGHLGQQPKLVASYLSDMRVARDDAHTTGADVAVVVGPDFRQGGIPGL
jgi:LCP family protein required for cell wall assembly